MEDLIFFTLTVVFMVFMLEPLTIGARKSTWVNKLVGAVGLILMGIVVITYMMVK